LPLRYDFWRAALAAWRDEVVRDAKLKSSATIASYFSRVRNVLRLAARGHLDPVQIEQALARCKAKLYPPPNNVHDDPRPITRQDFKKLLTAAEQTDVPQMWRAMLLLALNCALYMEDLCDLQWTFLDLERRTFISRRKKRGRCLRVAILWDETIAAIARLVVEIYGTTWQRNVVPEGEKTRSEVR
jgi:integrase